MVKICCFFNVIFCILIFQITILIDDSVIFLSLMNPRIVISCKWLNCVRFYSGEHNLVTLGIDNIAHITIHTNDPITFFIGYLWFWFRCIFSLNLFIYRWRNNLTFFSNMSNILSRHFTIKSTIHSGLNILIHRCNGYLTICT